MQIPNINNGKLPNEPLNVKHLFPLPSDTPYGNLSLKWLKIVSRVDRINNQIQQVFTSYVHPDSEQGWLTPSFDPDIHQFYAEQVVYWLRKTADELISLSYLLYEFYTEKNYPARIEVDCIGTLIYGKGLEEFRSKFEPFFSDLRVLNAISNAYKHSFINTDINLVGREEPVVFALYLNHNKLNSRPDFYAVSFADLIKRFNEFYIVAANLIRAQGYISS